MGFWITFLLDVVAILTIGTLYVYNDSLDVVDKFKNRRK